MWGCKADHISIHLMLRFIRFPRQWKRLEFRISIHLMLRFIYMLSCLYEIYRNFNTSHVTVYLKNSALKLGTTMYFNTSHVTVYPQAFISKQIGKISFQYISCYGLSENSLSPDSGDLLFQYISCYGLSWWTKGKRMH